MAKSYRPRPPHALSFACIRIDLDGVLVAQLHAHASITRVNSGICSVMHCAASRYPRRLAANQKQANEGNGRKAERGKKEINLTSPR